ncbi:MAG: hypothetical protein QXV22_02840 [Thermoplasmataceae archaeon]
MISRAYILQRIEYFQNETERIREENDQLQKTVIEMASRLDQIQQDKKVADSVYAILKGLSDSHGEE